jgi:RNA polymerase sigma-70 factor (ECF subfamily)
MNAPALNYASMTDLELADRVIDGDAAAIRFLTTRHNRSLYRAAWSILRDRGEAEEALQEAYLRAFRAMATFRGEASLATWLTRIVINEALARRRQITRQRAQLERMGVAQIDDYRERLMRGSYQSETADRAIARREVATLLETAIDQLPEAFRIVFILREVDGLSVEDTAEILKAPVGTIRTRLFGPDGDCAMSWDRRSEAFSPLRSSLLARTARP